MMGELWQPDQPCRAEVEYVIRFIRDRLVEAELVHVTEQDPDDPNLFLCAAHDEDSRINTGYVGWSPAGTVIFAAHKPEVENHDTAEGVPSEQSKCWWTPPSAEIFVMHLCGDVRAIVEKARAIAWNTPDEEGEKAAA